MNPLQPPNGQKMKWKQLLVVVTGHSEALAVRVNRSNLICVFRSKSQVIDRVSDSDHSDLFAWSLNRLISDFHFLDTCMWSLCTKYLLWVPFTSETISRKASNSDIKDKVASCCPCIRVPERKSSLRVSRSSHKRILPFVSGMWRLTLM